MALSSGATTSWLALLLLATCCLMVAAAAVDDASSASSDKLMMARFLRWQAEYNRSYPTEEERRRRFEVYRRNIEYIEATNRAGNLTYTLGENQFADLTEQEFLDMYTMKGMPSLSEGLIGHDAGKKGTPSYGGGASLGHDAGRKNGGGLGHDAGRKNGGGLGHDAGRKNGGGLGHDAGRKNGGGLGHDAGRKNGGGLGHDAGRKNGGGLGHDAGRKNGGGLGHDAGRKNGGGLGHDAGRKNGGGLGHDDGRKNGGGLGHDAGRKNGGGLGHDAGRKNGNVSAVDAPPTVDWRSKGAVTPIKNQGPSCSSCWAFVTAATIESITKIKTGKLVSLSEQELIDCDPYDGGCNLGYFVNGYKWVIENGGLTTEASYPYQARRNYCSRSKAAQHAARISDYVQVSAGEGNLQQAVAQQPVAAAIEMGGSLQFYSGGVFSGQCGTRMNHAITVVGYGADANTGLKYWIVKNSWGQSWGERGFLRIRRDATRSGLCGIALDLAYPVV